MRVLDSLRFRIAALFKRSEMSAEMEEELRAHVQLRADDLERSGVARAEAERRARIEFGGHVKFKEESREAAGGTCWNLCGWICDLRCGCCGSRRDLPWWRWRHWRWALARTRWCLEF